MVNKNKRKPYPIIHKNECKACARCVKACKKEVLKVSEELNDKGYHFVYYIGDGCNGCTNCYYTCPEPLANEVHIPLNKKGVKND